ncbi:hypothetical protein RRG08_044604 [Elysia crispata]|uniref:Uncharacterized protein n=1 Tax=Elysia crispata TaxID=231223 RepID=A0AAE1D117_9GAST|nr:hypothetical protein RRG08_044604 [Elysia crispata]
MHGKEVVEQYNPTSAPEFCEGGQRIGAGLQLVMASHIDAPDIFGIELVLAEFASAILFWHDLTGLERWNAEARNRVGGSKKSNPSGVNCFLSKGAER